MNPKDPAEALFLIQHIKYTRIAVFTIAFLLNFIVFYFFSKKIPVKNGKKLKGRIANFKKDCIVMKFSALVAQLDRAIASGAIGREFEPRRVHHHPFPVFQYNCFRGE